MFYDMTWLERILFLKRIKGGGTPAHEATSYTGSFFTDMVAPLKKLLVTLEPIQSGSGTPSPSNPCPISGHTDVVTEVCGKNLFDKENTTTLYCDGSMQLFDNATFKSVCVPLKGEVTYTYSQSALGQYARFALVNDITALTPLYNPVTKAIGMINRDGATSPISFTFTNTDFKYLVCTIYRSTTDGDYDAIADTCQLELGTTATDYEPYQGTTYATDLGRTVYGGSVDIVTGELIVDKGFVVFDGSETWTKNTRASNGFYTARPQGCKQSTTMVSDKFAYVDNVQDLYTTYGACFCGSSMNFNVDPETIGGSTIEDWKAWLANNPLQVVYELATPQTYQLTRQQINSLVGQNNIITEDGVEVSEIVYLTRLVGSPLLGSPQTEEPTEETDEDPAEESETE